ncbi:hypothetical protein F2Q69_00020045 [Brassica cretica]|uniref:Uncharacterized protein n=1 Tax=Brassica cretica TaxID=69181 RepID=A0A8S9Q4I2_BRACR|nr:hypothetical protein F2Q69_00020045 [Brassica cretica]
MEIGASIDTQPEPSFDCRFEATIDRALEAPIDSDLGNEIVDFPEGYIDSWENDYYKPSFIHFYPFKKEDPCRTARQA